MAINWKIENVVEHEGGTITVSVQEIIGAVPGRIFSKKFHKTETKVNIKRALARMVKAHRAKKIRLNKKIADADLSDFETVIGGLL